MTFDEAVNDPTSCGGKGCKNGRVAIDSPERPGFALVLYCCERPGHRGPHKDMRREEQPFVWYDDGRVFAGRPLRQGEQTNADDILGPGRITSIEDNCAACNHGVTEHDGEFMKACEHDGCTCPDFQSGLAKYLRDHGAKVPGDAT